MTPWSGSRDDTGWIYPALLNGWQQYSVGTWDAQYRCKNGVVHLRGLVKKAGVPLNTTMFVLPAGFRPNTWQIFGTANALNTSATAFNPTVMYIGSDGSVHAESGGSAIWTSLSGISFPADL